MLFLSCFCNAFLQVCLLMPCGHLLGCLIVKLSLPIGILGQMWCLIVSIPDLNLTFQSTNFNHVKHFSKNEGEGKVDRIGRKKSKPTYIIYGRLFLFVYNTKVFSYHSV